MYVITVKTDPAPTRLFIGCEGPACEVLEKCGAHGLMTEVEEVAEVPERDEAEQQRAESLMDLLFAVSSTTH